jgi:hypothetical protein
MDSISDSDSEDAGSIPAGVTSHFYQPCEFLPTVFLGRFQHLSGEEGIVLSHLDCKAILIFRNGFFISNGH